MNILNLLTQKKNVVGIEISDSLIRIAFFRRPSKPSWNKRGLGNTLGDQEELVLVEEPIGSNIIKNGVVVDRDLLTKTLQLIRAKIKIDTNYAIVSIPDDKIYSRIFSFPKSVGEARLPEAMRLAIGFQLPAKTEDVYLDWERVSGTHGVNEILLSTIDRTTAQGYVEALDKAGWKTLALESHLASIARAIKLDQSETTILTKKSHDGVTVFALRDGILRFSRTLPTLFVPEEKIPLEIQSIKNALETALKTPILEQAFSEAQICDEYANNPALTQPKAKWLIPLGAIMRGKIPEGKDNLISLLPVGTEEAYAYQKAVVFTAFFRNLTIGISVFFIASYLGAYLFILSLAQNATKTLTSISTSTISPDLLKQEDTIKNVNAITETAEIILKDTPLWSAILTEVQSKITDGIIITSFTASLATEKMSLVGVSRTRETLNRFKKNLQEAPMLSEVEIPLTSLAQKTNIPFSVSFRLKDPSTVYYK